MIEKPPTKFWIGLTFVLIGAIFMIFDLFPLPARITLGIIGIILITSKKIRE